MYTALYPSRQTLAISPQQTLLFRVHGGARGTPEGFSEGWRVAEYPQYPEVSWGVHVSVEDVLQCEGRDVTAPNLKEEGTL